MKTVQLYMGLIHFIHFIFFRLSLQMSVICFLFNIIQDAHRRYMGEYGKWMSIFEANVVLDTK